MTTGDVVVDKCKIRVMVSGGEGGDRQSQQHFSGQDESAEPEMKRLFIQAFYTTIQVMKVASYTW